MRNYSKLFGSLIGSVFGIATTFGVPLDWVTPEIQMAIATLLVALFGTWAAPANRID